MSNCPSCGRYVGPYDACPYCGAALSGRTPIRWLKVAALALALGGLALLWLLATRTDPPAVEVGQVDALMNMAYVRVTGRVARPPSYDPATGYLSFWLSDGSGELYVAAYQEESQALIAQGRTPALGDQVSLEGTLRIREDLIALTLNVPERLTIQRPEPVARPIGDVSAADELTRVRVRGQVRSVHVPYPGLTLIGLRDATGEIQLAVSEVITALGGDLPALAVGEAVEVVAPVSLYKDTPQLSLAAATDLTVLDESLVIAPASAIGQIEAQRVGRWLAVSGQVVQVASFSAGVKYTLDDGTGQITLLVWQDLHAQLADPGALAVGAQLRAQGEVAEYRGELEIVPELPLDLQSIPPTPTPPTPHTPTPTNTPIPTNTPTPTATSVPIGDLNASHSGTEVTVTGQVVDAASFSNGFKLALDDSSGHIALVLWNNVYDNCGEAPRLKVGATVRATGEIGQYQGELQIVPESGDAVSVTAPGGPAPPGREIGSLSAYLGQRVGISGQVARVEGIKDGIKAFVGDETGEVAVLLWNNVLERIAGNQALNTPGTRVRVVGVVQEYHGALELVPALPHDVEVLP